MGWRDASGSSERNDKMTTVYLDCPVCGERARLLDDEIVIAPCVEIRCPKCGTLWQIEGLIELGSDEVEDG